MAKRNRKTSKTQARKNSQALERRRGNGTTPFGISPFSVVKRFGEEMDRLFGDFGLDRNWIPPALTVEAGRTWAPEIEIFERDGELVVRADLPGLKKEDVKVELTDEGLTIEGERRSEHEENGEGYYRSERNYGNFYRRLPLPEGADPDDATAKFHDGVLEVTMPARKPVARVARKLTIQEGSQPKSKAKAA
jgi:HSP20 family protein